MGVTTSFSDDQHSIPIGTEVDILLTGFVDHLNTTRLTDAKKMDLRQNWLIILTTIAIMTNLYLFGHYFPDSALEPNRSRALFPDTIEFQLKLSGGNQNEKTVPYGLALLKAASGIWDTNVRSRVNPVGRRSPHLSRQRQYRARRFSSRPTTASYLTGNIEQPTTTWLSRAIRAHWHKSNRCSNITDSETHRIQANVECRREIEQ